MVVSEAQLASLKSEYFWNYQHTSTEYCPDFPLPLMGGAVAVPGICYANPTRFHEGTLYYHLYSRMSAAKFFAVALDPSVRDLWKKRAYVAWKLKQVVDFFFGGNSCEEEETRNEESNPTYRLVVEIRLWAALDDFMRSLRLSPANRRGGFKRRVRAKCLVAHKVFEELLLAPLRQMGAF